MLGQAGPGVRGFFIKLLSDPGDTLLAKPVDVVLTAVPVVSAIGKSGSAVANSQRFKNAKANIDRKVDEIRVGMANSPSPAVKRSGELLETALSASKNKYASFKAYFDDPATVATPEGTELVKAGTSVADESRKAVEGEFNIMAEQLGDAIRGGDGSMSPPRPTRFRNVDDTPPPDPATESSVNFVMPHRGLSQTPQQSFALPRACACPMTLTQALASRGLATWADCPPHHHHCPLHLRQSLSEDPSEGSYLLFAGTP